MTKPISVPVFSFTIILLLSACSENDDGATLPPVPESIDQAAAAASAKHCFRNEHAIGDAKDVEELIVAIDDSAATGEYNWIPAYKDKRLGKFTGTVEGQIVSATYTYEQEGQSADAAITITLDEKQAAVKGGAPELGLNQTLARVDC